MRELLPSLKRWVARGDDVALGVVVATRHSAPRPVGSALAVSSTGELVGSVSGGCVENEVAHEARARLAGDAAGTITYGITDDQALEIGLPCGGEIDVFVSRADRDLVQRAIAALDEGFVVEPREVDGRLELDVRPPPRLLVLGAVELTEALCRAARLLGWHTIVADPRAKLATPERVPSADEIHVAWPDEAVENAAPDSATAIVVLTHEDRFDIPALSAALASEAFYVGALGSRRTQARRREQLVDQGVSDDALERIHGPVGLDLGAETTAETALAILAEIVAARRGRTASSLRERDTPIHAA
ncbi:MAG TPA: XdhC/CoxI family protein [Gaiellaceae bacterium]|nr:XdhC/CoxI family protein [Gaiellaceae bacterium]